MLFALPQRVVAAAARRPDRRLVARSAQHPDSPFDGAFDDIAPGQVTGWAAYVAGVAWALRDAGHDLGGVDLLVDGTVPVGAGLSSSAALACATATALDGLFSLGLTRTVLAAVARRAENVFVGVPCGILDQSASLLCTEGHALLLDTRTQATEQIPLDLAAAGLTLLVVDTRAPHALADGEYAARHRDCERAARLLGVPALRDATLDDLVALGEPTLRRRARHVVTENCRVRATADLLRAGDLRGIGPLLTASHRSLRDDFEVTVARLDVAVEAALGAGAHGARMTGGGFGGCVIALVEVDAAERTAAAVASAFAGRGFGAPTHFTAAPSAGAHRVG
jgi:galactokinase